MNERLRILLMTADPSNAIRLRLGDEMREIQRQLQLSVDRDKYSLEMRPSVRPADLTQAIVDVKPHIVHFSGHGTETGEICLQNDLDEVYAVPPDALADLFKLVADQVRCVVLNACYSERQARAIAQHIDYVIGMDGGIGDPAAIRFSVGFYKALCGGYPIEKAYQFGLVELKLMQIPYDLTPVLIRKPPMTTDWEITITVPEGFKVHETNYLLDFVNWLNTPIGRSADATQHPIQGIVTPSDLAAAVNIQIYTNQWYQQCLCPIQKDGSFSGSVWLHDSRPSATFRFDILDNRRNLLERFAVGVS